MQNTEFSGRSIAAMRINASQISMFLIASLPILSMYKSPLPYFDLGLF